MWSMSHVTSIQARKLWDLPELPVPLFGSYNWMHLVIEQLDLCILCLDLPQYKTIITHLLRRTSSVAIRIVSRVGEWAQGHRNPKRSSPCSGSSLVPSSPRCSLPSPKFNSTGLSGNMLFRTAQSSRGPSCLKCSGVKAKSKLERCTWRT